ncbi:hypothetical protein ACOJVU_10185 [Mycobacterium sp. THU-M104]|uniref:hypothetical protein n=1 Tax=Mycobacterium sp. THU-M104 TaxID=3410515 RepID=UPI003B9BAA69
MISNDRGLSDAELLTAYKYQPNLEKRHAQLKGTQLVAPMFLHDTARIEGLLCCHFIAMLVQGARLPRFGRGVQWQKLLH